MSDGHETHETVVQKMQELLHLLNDVNADDSLPEEGIERIFLTDGYPDELPQRMQDILSLCDCVLITPRGQPRWETISWFRKNGFNIGPGEQDSFGWLTGVIRTRKGRIVFG